MHQRYNNTTYNSIYLRERKFIANKLRLIPLTISVSIGFIISSIFGMDEFNSIKVGGISLLQVIRGGLIMSMILALPKSAYFIFTNNRLSRCLLLLTMYIIIMIPLRPYPIEDLVIIFRILFILVIFVSAFEYFRRGWIGMKWIIFVGWFILFSTITMQIIGYQLGIEAYETYYALGGITGSGRLPSEALLAIVPIFFLQNQKSLSVIIGYLFITGGIVGSLRRSSFVGLVITFIISSLFDLKYNRNIAYKFYIVLILSLISISIYYILFNTPTGVYFQERLHGLIISEGGTGSGRSIFMPIVLDGIFSRELYYFLFGEGFGAVRDLLARTFGPEIGSHNAWLDLTHALGLIGLLLFVWFHYEVYRIIKYSTGRYKIAVTSGFIILMVVGMTTGSYFSPSFAPIFIIFGAYSIQITKKYYEVANEAKNIIN